MHELRARLDVGTDGLVLDIGFESLPLSLNAHERRILTHCTGRVLAKLELGCSEQPFGRSVAVSYRVRRERSAREPDSVEEPPGTPAGADCPSPAQPDHEGTLGGVYVMRAGKGTLPAMRVTAALAEPAAIREGMLWGSSAATLIATCAATYLPTDGEISLKAKLSADRRGRVKSFAIERESFALAQESALAITACARDGFEQLDLGCSTRKLRNVTVTYKVTRLPPD
jgi:hypothetical protein